jgi:hypothetical protein
MKESLPNTNTEPDGNPPRTAATTLTDHEGGRGAARLDERGGQPVTAEAGRGQPVTAEISSNSIRVLTSRP